VHPALLTEAGGCGTDATLCRVVPDRGAVYSPGHLDTRSARTSLRPRVDFVFITPSLQRSFGRVLFEGIPVLENATVVKKVLEAAVSPTLVEVAEHSVKFPGQVLLSERQRDLSAEVQLVLVRQRQISVRHFEVLGDFFLEIDDIGDKVEGAAIEVDERSAFQGRAGACEFEGVDELRPLHGNHGVV
jgi:hypothetical protein